MPCVDFRIIHVHLHIQVHIIYTCMTHTHGVRRWVSENVLLELLWGTRMRKTKREVSNTMCRGSKAGPGVPWDSEALSRAHVHLVYQYAA